MSCYMDRRYGRVIRLGASHLFQRTIHSSVPSTPCFRWLIVPCNSSSNGLLCPLLASLAARPTINTHTLTYICTKIKIISFSLFYFLAKIFTQRILIMSFSLPTHPKSFSPPYHPLFSLSKQN